MACAVGVETVCLYDIFNARAFSFIFPTHVIRFRCPLVYTDVLRLRNPQLAKVCRY